MPERLNSASTSRRAGAGRRFAVLTACFLVYGYLGVLLAVAIHEFLGHGLMSLVLGGEFTGVMLDFDGMGWASFGHSQFSTTQEGIVLAGGVIATTLAGGCFAACAWWSRSRIAIAVPFIAFAANCLLEGGPYMLFNGVHPVPPGDIGRLVQLNANVRVPFVVAGLVVTVAAMWMLVGAVIWAIESHVLDGQAMRGWTRTTACLLVGVAAGAVNLIFDWEQLAPGIGWWPYAAMLALGVAAGATTSVARLPPHRAHDDGRATGLSLALGVAALATVCVIVGFGLRNGVYW